MKRVVVVAVACWACGSGTAPEDSEHPRDIAVEGSALAATVAALAADSMCGRGSATIYEREAADYLRDAFIAFGLAPAGADYLQEFPATRHADHGGGGPPGMCDTTTTAVSQNVLAALTGTGSLQSQWVVLGAHYDHVGWNQQGTTVVIYNGADDNASGTAVLLETADLLARFASTRGDLERRSILFSAYGSEEMGLVGSNHFAANPTVPLDSIVAMVNLDMVGRLRNNQLTAGGAAQSPEWAARLTAADPVGLTFAYDNQFVDRTDIYAFFRNGIPAVHLFTGLHIDYHAPSDDVDLLNYDGMAQLTRLVLALVWDLAVDPQPFATTVAPAGAAVDAKVAPVNR